MRALAAGLAFWAMAGAASTQGVSGYWTGAYTCAQGLTGVTLEMREKKGDVSAVVSFYEHPENRGVPSGCFTVAGKYDARSGALNLTQKQWIVRPNDYYMIDFAGRLDAKGQTYSGDVGFPIAPGLCTTFTMRRAERPADPRKDACRAAPVS